ncbi:transcriptional repressor [Geitlerinema sp. PCC 9228]|uniref:transcriptional repressor n=1 Tax=Geitlerinema sp. PCC 9228 TaxID=111611 RepID=UPI0008F9C931|nr:transcriptional repressor [Geitlerinema sp. PCC 9228]
MALYTAASLKSELHQRGCRMTPQREKILHIFQTLPQGKHLSAEELYQILCDRHEPVSLSTVYRNVSLMARLGILRELELAEGHKHYELNRPHPEHHHHLVCVLCHRTLEFKNDSVLQTGYKQAEASQYQLLDCQMTIHAVCEEAVEAGWPSLPENWTCPKRCNRSQPLPDS